MYHSSKMPPKKETVKEDELVTSWDIGVEVAAELNEPLWAVKNVIRLLKEENTIPFIARYSLGSGGGYLSFGSGLFLVG